MALTKEQSLREAIAQEEQNLAELAHRHDESRRRLVELKQELATMVSSPADLSAPVVQPRVDIPLQKEKSIYSGIYSVAGMTSTQSSG